MAKCVELSKTQSIVRVPDEEARRLVNRGLGKFVPKSKYKEQQKEGIHGQEG